MLAEINWNAVEAIGTIAAAVLTLAAVVIALVATLREGKATREALAISQRMLQHAEEDRREAGRAQIELEWATYRVQPARSDGLGRGTLEERLRVTNVGPGRATGIVIEAANRLSIGDELTVSIKSLAPGRSVVPLDILARTVNEEIASTATVSWTDGAGAHTVVVPIPASLPDA